MDNVIDNHFMQHLEQKMGYGTFVRVDSDTADNLVQTDEEKESVLSKKEQEKVEEIFKSVLPETGGPNLELKALAPSDLPVIVTRPEFMRRMMEMQNLQSMGGSDMPEIFNVVVNLSLIHI